MMESPQVIVIDRVIRSVIQLYYQANQCDTFAIELEKNKKVINGPIGMVVSKKLEYTLTEICNIFESCYQEYRVTSFEFKFKKVSTGNTVTVKGTLDKKGVLVLFKQVYTSPGITVQSEEDPC